MLSWSHPSEDKTTQVLATKLCKLYQQYRSCCMMCKCKRGHLFHLSEPQTFLNWDKSSWKKWLSTILNKIINAPCGTLKLLLALGVAKYIKSYKIYFVVQYATDYCPLEHDNYKTISAHLGSPISCYINNLHGAFIFLLSVFYCG